MANFKRGQFQILRGSNPILNIGKANYQGGGKSIPRGGESTPSPPPEINPVIYRNSFLGFWPSVYKRSTLFLIQREREGDTLSS